MKVIVLFPVLAFGFLSCSPVSSVVQKAGQPLQVKLQKGVSKLRQVRLPGRAPSQRNIPPVVEVRREDLRKLPTGREKARDWARSQEAASLVTTSTGFDPDSLASGMPFPTSGILPALGPGGAPSPTSEEADLPDFSRADFTDDRGE